MIFHDEINGQDASGMNDGVFQQIDGDLLDQHCIHGYHQKFLGDLHPDGRVGITLFQFFQSFPNHFFHGFFRGIDAQAVSLDTGDGQ